MELWIRSQDKKLFEKAYMIKAGIVDNQPVIVVNNDYVYGNYKTIERALEVLDEIQNIMQPVIMYSPVVKDMTKPEDCYKRVELESYNSSIEMLDTYVYEMPEE